MKPLRFKKIARSMFFAHLINWVFMIFVVFYYCMELKIEEQTVALNPHLLLTCTPYILIYLLLECWLFPKYIRTRRVRL